MPGYVIHMSIGKVYKTKNKLKNSKQFMQGVIAPDMTENKQISHYGPYSSNPGLKEFLEIKGISDSFNEGYFLHLVSDYLFYNKFLVSLDNVINMIYDDYDKLNKKLLQRYRIRIPKEIKKIVKFKDGETRILNEEEICKFIEFVGNLDIRNMSIDEIKRIDINYL